MTWKTGDIIDRVQAAIPSACGKRSTPRGTRDAFTGHKLLKCRIAIAIAALATVLVAPNAYSKPAQIKILKSMEFGTIAADATLPGYVTIDPVTKTKTVGGGVYDFGGGDRPLHFDIRGDKGMPYTITLPSSVTLTSGTSSMTLGNFTTDTPLIGVFVKGMYRIELGGTLQVAANQAPGTYSGLIDITVNY